MKKIRIFALPSHQQKERTSGVDFARIIQPMTYLNGYKDEEVEFKVDIYNIHDPKYSLDAEKQVDWLNISKQYDVIYLNYINNPWAFAAMGAMARKNGVKIVLDLDDALWNIKPDNPAYTAFNANNKEALKNFDCIVNEVDLVTVTSSYLKHVVMNHTQKKADQIVVIDNFIDLDKYNFRPKFKNDGRIQILHFGSTTHFMDLAEKEFTEGIGKIMSEYPNVTIKFVGAFLPKLKDRWGARYEQAYGHVDIHKWIEGPYREFMEGADIVIAPLIDDLYNRAKSGIKFLEYSAAGKPGIYQDLKQYSQYIVEGENGYLATRSRDWYVAMKKMIDDPKHRQEVGQKAFETLKDYTIQGNVYRYADAFKKLVDF